VAHATIGNAVPVARQMPGLQLSIYIRIGIIKSYENTC